MSRSPDIIVFLSDDHAQWALRCYGNREIHTPALDALAGGGARCANAFTPCPVCSPARASFWTGLLPSQHGIHDWLAESGVGAAHSGLKGFATLGSLLQDRGYQTAMIGKWHCGNGDHPARGFDRWFSHLTEYTGHTKLERVSDEGTITSRDDYVETCLGDEAIGFLEQCDPDRPLFLYVGFTATHGPFRGHPPEWVQRYADATFADIPSERPPDAYTIPTHASLPEPATHRRWLTEYYAAVSHIDQQVGRVLATLRRLRGSENTVTVYTADHGHMCGHHGLWRKGNATIPQNFFEESIRIPLLVTWPGRTSPGQVLEASVDLCDLHETIRVAAGVTDATPPARPGRAIAFQQAESRPCQFAEYGDARIVRDERFKLIRYYNDEQQPRHDILYDLHHDPRETTNVAGNTALQDDHNRLVLALDAHFAKYTVPEHTGLGVMSRAPHNPHEPWRAYRRLAGSR